MKNKIGQQFIDYVLGILKKRQTENSKYSFNQFARDLKVSPGALFEVLYKDRELSLQFAQKIQNGLQINAMDFSQMTVDLLYKSQVQRIELDEFCFESLVAIEYISQSTGPFSLDWVQEKSGLSDERLDQIICKLVDKGLVEDVSEISETDPVPAKSYRLKNEVDSGVRIELQSELSMSQSQIAYQMAMTRTQEALIQQPKGVMGMMHVFPFKKEELQQKMFDLQQKSNSLVKDLKASSEDLEASEPYLLFVVAVPLKKK